MSTSDDERTLDEQPTADGRAARTTGRIVLGLGSLGTLFGLYVPLMNHPGNVESYSLFESANDLGTPGVWLVLAGSAALLLVATLLFDRVQTRTTLGAMLVLACLQAVGALTVSLIGYTLIWSHTRDAIRAELGSKVLAEADFTVAAAIPLLSPALILAGAIWWCLNAPNQPQRNR